VSDIFDPTTSFFHLGLEEGKMSDWPELDLQNFRELRLDLCQKVLHFIRIMDQGVNQSRERVLHMSKLVHDASRLQLLMIYIEQD
jgi:hypothetical protein